MKLFGQFALRISTFVAGLLVLLFAASVVLQPKNNDAGAGMNDVSASGILAEKENTVDVLILGDSEAYSSFVPLKIWADTGITSYVCATPAQKLSYSLEFLKKTFKTQSPKIVILETNALFRHVSVSDGIKQALEEKISVFRYHNRWKTLKLKDFSFSTDYTDTQVNKGYIYSNGVAPSANTDYMSKSAVPVSIQRQNSIYVKEIKKICDENGARLIFISTPSTVNWNKNKHDTTAALAEKLDAEFIDLNTAVLENPIDWTTDTKDKGDHLNYSGAVKVTSFLGKYLAETGLFSDKRGDGNFAEWDNDVRKFTDGSGISL